MIQLNAQLHSCAQHLQDNNAIVWGHYASHWRLRSNQTDCGMLWRALEANAKRITYNIIAVACSEFITETLLASTSCASERQPAGWEGSFPSKIETEQLPGVITIEQYQLQREIEKPQKSVSRSDHLKPSVGRLNFSPPPPPTRLSATFHFSVWNIFLYLQNRITRNYKKKC